MKKTALRKWLLMGAGGLVILALGAWWLAPAKPKMDFLTVAPKRADIESAVLATGALEAYQQVNVGAQVSGQLRSLKVELGQSVKKGQLLAEIDPVLQQNDLKKAQASLNSAQAQKRAKQALLEQYRLAFERQKSLNQADAGARADLEQARAQLVSTQAELSSLDAQIAQAEIAVDTAKANLGYTRITAPMDGVVIAIVTKEGQTVVSNQSAPTILILANLDTMTVKAEISEADVTKVKAGMPVYFTTLGDPDHRYQAKLRSVEPAPTTVSDSSSSNSSSSSSSSSTAIYYYGRFDVPNPDHQLRLSMTAQVHIVLAEAKGALCIPVSQLGKQLGPDSYQVLVMGKDHPMPRQIKTGVRDNVNVQVLEGLTEQDRLVVGDNALKYSGEERRRHGPFGF
ncbi:macrolide transporter subunit MacA [Gallaecimonas kandeliae]|uniref:macrolide transporter subunit MacA n=1 Tax=Gallaecimonas kandeliae TaxID=3029055 RepID=UPI00264949D3|nr:macrolide transporter subunit MacA [Gallaecimonas kandeliae]WKE64556.1 macrolide transporter subunit MacA [Gallaecimonas kandeliae]